MKRLWVYSSCLLLLAGVSYFLINCWQPKKSYALSICAIFRNEAPYLKEWIEYHKLVGVEHFYLYNNESTDNYRKVLSPYIRSKEVTLIDWPDRGMETWENKICAWVGTTQVPAYVHAFEMGKGISKWMAAIDIDEFIVPVKGEKVTEVLERYENDFPGVEIFWRMYGTSGVKEVPQDSLMIEVLTRRAREEFLLNRYPKTIVRPEFFKEYFWTPHRCNYIGGRKSAYVDNREMVINHYSNRTESYFFSTKLKKKEHMENYKFDSKQIADMLSWGNDMEDSEKTIYRFVPALRAKMGLSPRPSA